MSSEIDVSNGTIAFDDNLHDVLSTTEPCFRSGVSSVSLGECSDVVVSTKSIGVTSVTAVASCNLRGGVVRAGFGDSAGEGNVSVILSMNVDMPTSSMARAAVTVAESIICVLQDLDVRDGKGRSASGFVNQSVSVVRDRGSSLYLKGTGKHSILGQLIGETVYEAVRKSAEKSVDIDNSIHGMLSRRGLPDIDCSDVATISAVLFLADEISWGLIPSDVGKKVVESILKTVTEGDVSDIISRITGRDNPSDSHTPRQDGHGRIRLRQS